MRLRGTIPHPQRIVVLLHGARRDHVRFAERLRGRLLELSHVRNLLSAHVLCRNERRVQVGDIDHLCVAACLPISRGRPPTLLKRIRQTQVRIVLQFLDMLLVTRWMDN